MKSHAIKTAFARLLCKIRLFAVAGGGFHIRFRRSAKPTFSARSLDDNREPCRVMFGDSARKPFCHASGCGHCPDVNWCCHAYKFHHKRTVVCLAVAVLGCATLSTASAFNITLTNSSNRILYGSATWQGSYPKDCPNDPPDTCNCSQGGSGGGTMGYFYAHSVGGMSWNASPVPCVSPGKPVVVSITWSYTDYQDPNYTVAGGTTKTFTGDVVVDINAESGCSTNVCFNIRNSDPVPHFYAALWKDGNGISHPQEDVYQLQPGESKSDCIHMPCGEVAATTLNVFVPSASNPAGTCTDGYWTPTGATGVGNPGQDPNIQPPNPAITNLVYTVTNSTSLYGTNTVGANNNLQTPTGVSFNPLANGSTNILFTGTNVATSIQQGDSALFDELAKLGAQAHADAQTIASEIGTNGIAGAGQGGDSTNMFDLTLTNYATQTGQSNVLVTLGGISNLLSSMTGTNLSGSNLWSSVPSTATNGTSASNAAISATGDYGVAGLIADLVPVATDDANGGSSPDMTMSFMGQVIDFDPVHQFPAVQSLSYNGLKLVAELFFLAAVSKLFWDVVRAKSAVQTGGVPDLDATVGGSLAGFGGTWGSNVLGVLVALVVPAVFIGLFGLVMAWLFANLGIVIGDVMNLTAWESGLSPIAFYLLTSFVPVKIIFTLSVTLIVLRFTMAKLFDIAASASRYLWGK